jgi:hypothetical protein
MIEPPIAHALASGVKAYAAGAVVDLVSYHKLKLAILPFGRRRRV